MCQKKQFVLIKELSIQSRLPKGLRKREEIDEINTAIAIQIEPWIECRIRRISPEGLGKEEKITEADEAVCIEIR